MNEIAAKLGEVGLPMPVAEIASRDWDVVIVGGGHNGLTAAAYLARAGSSVLVLERRERLGGACTLERPFADERFVVSPCAYVVGLLDDVVIDELALANRGLRYWMADPNLWVPFDDGTSFGQFLDDADTQRNLDALGLSKQDIDGYWAYEELFDDARKLLRKGERDAWEGETPTREEIEAMLGGDEEKIALVFEDSIADVLDRYIDDERIKTALYGQGIIGTWGGPYDHGTASIKLMHYQGDMGGQGPVWGYVEGGMGMVSFAIADAAREAGATLCCGVPVARIIPGEGVELEDGTAIRSRTVISNADPKRTLDLVGAKAVREADPASSTGSRAGRSAAPSSSSMPLSTACRAGRRRRARTGRRERPSMPAGRWKRPSGRSSAVRPASRRSPSARSTSRPDTTRARRRTASS